MPDAAANNENHLLIRIDERVKGLDKKVDRFIAHEEAQDARIRDNENVIAKHGERLDSVTKLFGMIQIGFAAVVAWLQVRA